MNKQKYYIIIIIVLFGFNLALGYKYITQKEYVSAKLGLLKNDISKRHDEIDLLREEKNKVIEQFIFYDNYQISLDIKVYTIDNKFVDLNSIVDKRKLVYRISDNVCSICYDTTIAEMKKFSNEIDVNDIIILVPFDRMRDLKAYLDELNTNIQFYGVKKDELNIPVDDHSPFFFYTDSSLKIRHLFIPSKSEVDTTRQYFDLIKGKMV